MTISAYIARVREMLAKAPVIVENVLLFHQARLWDETNDRGIFLKYEEPMNIEPAYKLLANSHAELSRLCRALEVADRALERVAKIRTLPLTDIHDTDAEIASQYSSVLDTLVYGAKEARAEVERILNEELK